MTDLFFELQDELLPVLKSGDLDRCETIAVEKLLTLARSPFHLVLDLSITNDPKDAADYVWTFIRCEEHRFPVRAVYAEMNGFFINPDMWFFEVFGYDSYGGDEDYDWLCEWQSSEYEAFRLTGLEELQQTYAANLNKFDSNFDDAADVTALLVTIKFQKLITKAYSFLSDLRIPVLSTAHDLDFIHVISPKFESVAGTTNETTFHPE